MYFEEAEQMDTTIDLYTLQKDPDCIFFHFMKYGDEVFYVLKDEKIYGIITPGDLIRSYRDGYSIPKVNCNFLYVEGRKNEKTADLIFEKYPTIHEVAVIKADRFMGVLKNGYRKSKKEWEDTRRLLQEAFFKVRRTNWKKKDIRKILSLKCDIYVYNAPSIDDIKLTEDEYIVYQEKNKLNADEIDVLTQREREIFFGNSLYEYGYQIIEEFSNLKLVYMNGIPSYGDLDNRVYKIKDGYRVVPNSPERASKKIIIVGPCTMFGLYVEDCHTVATYLQQYVLTEGFHDYEVVNCALHDEYSIPRLFNEKISPEDIVVIMTADFDLWHLYQKEYASKLKCLGSMSEIWKEIEQPVYQIFNDARHCNHVVNEKIAEKIFRDIKVGGALSTHKRNRDCEVLQDYYISYDIVEYYMRHFINYSGRQTEGKTGAIVMTCNPFTKGHRYLVEYACRKVDYLYIFVVEEDRFEFSFKERYEMVKSGTSDLENVCVIPSGEHLASEETVPQYFNRDKVINVEDVEDTDYDFHIFGEVVAKILDITYRFVGAEPFCKVTANYNETMKRILPQHGVEVIEIDRARNDADEIISASKVRRYIDEGNKEKLEQMLPVSTLEYLKICHEKGYKI